MRVGVVIPAYKAPEKLKKCQQHLVKASESELEAIIIDNSTLNTGFTKAANLGILQCLEKGYEYAVVLNQDCYLKKGAIDKMVQFMEEKPECFIGGIKQLSDKNEDLIVHGGCQEAFPVGRHITGRVSKGDCKENSQMPWVNGACFIVRLSLIPHIGLMDENYFLIGSESDWCYTARQRGYEVWYIADAECVHEMGVSANDEMASIKEQDMIHFYDKWIAGEEFKELANEVF